MKIYQTLYNSDMTEGRGPMVPGPAFLHKEHADEYVDAQPGCMGRRAKWSAEKYGDWTVRVVDVHEHSLIAIEKRREAVARNALNKLTEEERQALGLKDTK